MHIYDSAKKAKLLFSPINKDEALIYVCGPTVYDDAHLGHARSALAFDLLRRVLTHLGYKVTFAKNFTDIDDKIIKKMRESGKSLDEITSFYTKRYKGDMRAIGVQDADIEPKATQSLKTIIDFTQNLLNSGHAYITSSGVYFDTSKDDKYLSLSRRYIDENDMRSRVEEDEEKRDIKDFALWKFAKKDDVSYPAPFGEGRPGWHIECSAMIKEYLANKKGEYQIDIHAGGMDLLFPHHENEAAQTRKESSQEIAKYWMHNGFVTINGEKMSKSLGNSFFLKDILKIYDGEIVRFYLLSTHYRANINFNETDLLQSKKRLDKIYRLKKRVADIQSSPRPDMEFEHGIMQALKDDLNISKALSTIDAMIADANDALDKNPKDNDKKALFAANIKLINFVLGIGEKEAFEYLHLGVSEEEKMQIESLLKERLEARVKKEFKKADFIRDELAKKGISLMDSADGTKWEKVDI
ncbi:MAG: cysteine--tRNA ligase [Campylobacteraceae bacterium]|jgi:cysteinyl-tRNA synthetase|nr:cysteine--tRNA ligase [Campylobacteraceae bacterium]